MSLILLGLLLFAVQILSFENNCVVQQAVDNKVFFSYPVDVFDSKLLGNTENLTNCLAFESFNKTHKHQFVEHKCLLPYKLDNVSCPVHDQNIVEATEKSHKRLLSKDSMCHLNSHLTNQSAVVNIFVFGGSVTGGGETEGCLRKLDSHNGYGTSLECSWPNFFHQVLKKNSQAQVKWHNIAVSGTNSGIMAANVAAYLVDHIGVTSMSSSDLVLIDYSANDGQTYGEIAKLEQDLELLIRHIYHFAVPADSLPTVVILEFFHPPGAVYKQAYGKVAKHYNLPIWSFDDAVSSKYLDKKQSEYASHLRLQHCYSFPHAAWPVHMWYADLLASIMLRELAGCKDNNLFGRRVTLPKPMFISEECKAGFENLLFISARDEHIKNATYESVPEHSWKLYADSKGKLGFISHFNSSGTTISSDKGPHTLTINSVAPIAKDFSQYSSNYGLTIEYLRTYYNGGVANVFLCGGNVKVASLDGLWQQGAKKISVSQLFSVTISAQQLAQSCVGAAHVYLTVVHSYVEQNQNHVSGGYILGNQTATHLARHQQKLKIISVQLCPLEH